MAMATHARAAGINLSMVALVKRDDTELPERLAKLGPDRHVVGLMPGSLPGKPVALRQAALLAW
eukprot:13542026-Alexandrium_andersonii.AAC.1